MTEAKQQMLLSKFLDRETSEHENQQLEKLLAESHEMRALKAELLDIQNDARVEHEECYSKLEDRITLAVQERYPAKQQTLAGWPFSSLRWSGIAAGLGALSITGWLVFSALNLQENNSNVELSDSPVQQLIGEVMLAQQQYHRAIEELEALAFMKIGELPEELASVFVENLEIVSEAISLYESSLIANRSNFLVYDTLAKMYQTKIDLLTSILMV